MTLPCFKPANALGSPIQSRSSGPFTTEADCLNACKEGACCEGTACTVKPQCQCQGTGKTFKGVGTVCETATCLCCNEQGYPKSSTDCAWCWCFCGEGTAPYPRFVNVSLSGTYQMVQPIFRPVLNGAVFEGFRTKTKSLSGTVTLSSVSPPSRLNCPNWNYGSAQSGSHLPLGSGGATGQVSLTLSNPSPTSVSVSCLIYIIDVSEDLGFSNPETWATLYTQGQPAGYLASPLLGSQATLGPYASGTCLSAMAGMTHEIIQEPFSISVVVNAVQA